MSRRGVVFGLLPGLLLLLPGSLLLLPDSERLHAQAANQPREVPQASAPDTGTQPPSLRKRSAARGDEDPHAASQPLAATGHTDMPPESEGRYPWDKHGGEIELYFEEGRLKGYMTEQVDPDPHVAAVTYRFVTTHVDGHALAFATQAIHGVSYSFSGHLERGTTASTTASPALPGSYLLTGTLVTHGSGADDLKQIVSLKHKPGS